MPLKVYNNNNIILLKWSFIISILLTLIQSISSVDPRYGHTATLINDTIYFVGGKTNGDRFTVDFISLNLSNTFLLNIPPWLEQDSTGMPLTYDHSAVAGGLNYTKIVVFGGGVGDPASAAMPSLTVYDPILKFWNRLTISSTPIRRFKHSAAILSNQNMLIYGGEVGSETGSQTSFVEYDFWSFNTISLSAWQGLPSLANSPGMRERHTTSVIGNKMIILGGTDGKSLISMSLIYVFDSVAVNWTLITATGQVPSPRNDHSAVDNTTIFGDVAVLDTTYWSWVAPPTNNTPVNRSQHSATIFGANMIVAFGIISPGAGPGNIDNQIYCLNLLNWTWVNNYVPQSFPPDRNLTTPPTTTITPTWTSATASPTITSTNPIKNDDQEISISKGLAIGLLVLLLIVCISIIAFIIYYINHQRKISNGDTSNQIDTEEQMTQPQNSIFAQTLLGNTSNNDIRPADPENGKRRSVKFSETNITITPVVYTKGHHPQGSLEVELGNTNDLNVINGVSGRDIITRTGMETEDGGSRSRRLSSLSINIMNIGRGLDVQMQSSAMLVSRNELRVVNPDITDQDDNN
ncbi:10399_t:CDS:2 [Dentiscutata erythropus]|uniref:10399_t:CDS:1 n=1 Tax=Dentiscutata erythropus TaxID=1348616 RepID=A0A9N8VQ11_9GLOM|nr:10399_t:CDS:2 [Dentiscutata erythropus]